MRVGRVEQRDGQRQLEWAAINQALGDNAMAVTRAMRRFRSEIGQEQVERVLTSYEAGFFLINRLGAEGVIDQDPCRRPAPFSAAAHR